MHKTLLFVTLFALSGFVLDTLWIITLFFIVVCIQWL